MPRPNILLITVDRWLGALLGLAWRADIDTPALDQIGRNGIWFPCHVRMPCPNSRSVFRRAEQS